MSNWRPKQYRNNGFTNAFERGRLAQHGIYLGAYARRADNPPTPLGAGASPQPYSNMGTRFSTNTTPPTQAQLEAYQHSQQPQNRYGGGYRRDGVKQEGRGYRDSWLSERHRLWGKDIPATDIDLLLIEFDSGKAVAMVEYKCGVTDNGYPLPEPDFDLLTYKAQIDFTNRADLYFFVVYYFKGTKTFRCYCANAKSLALSKGRTEILFTEEEWVERLYRIRGRELPDEIRATLSKTK